MGGYSSKTSLINVFLGSNLAPVAEVWPGRHRGGSTDWLDALESREPRRPLGYSNSWMVYFMENPIEMDDLGVPLF